MPTARDRSSSNRSTGAPRAQVRFELRQFRGHRLADEDLWIRRLTLLRALAVGDDLFRVVERLQERVLEAQRVLEQGVAEVRRGALGAASERGAIGRRRGHDQRAVVLERLDESP